MQTSNKIVRTSKPQRVKSDKSYSDMKVEGRKGRPNSRTRRQAIADKRTFELEC
jgi:hypothetical protein